MSGTCPPAPAATVFRGFRGLKRYPASTRMRLTKEFRENTPWQSWLADLPNSVLTVDNAQSVKNSVQKRGRRPKTVGVE